MRDISDNKCITIETYWYTNTIYNYRHQFVARLAMPDLCVWYRLSGGEVKASLIPIGLQKDNTDIHTCALINVCYIYYVDQWRFFYYNYASATHAQRARNIHVRFNYNVFLNVHSVKLWLDRKIVAGDCV